MSVDIDRRVAKAVGFNYVVTDVDTPEEAIWVNGSRFSPSDRLADAYLAAAKAGYTPHHLALTICRLVLAFGERQDVPGTDPSERSGHDGNDTVSPEAGPEV